MSLAIKENWIFFYAEEKWIFFLFFFGREMDLRAIQKELNEDVSL